MTDAQLAVVGGAHARLGDRMISVEETKRPGLDPDGRWLAVGTVTVNIWEVVGGRPYLAEVYIYAGREVFEAALD